jgi:hypothetical protein
MRAKQERSDKRAIMVKLWVTRGTGAATSNLGADAALTRHT